MLTIYCDNITPRLSYTLEVLFEDLLDCPITLSQDSRTINEKPALNYSHKSIEGVPYIRPHSLLFENGTRTLGESLTQNGILFPAESDLVTQDIFAASFFLMSRYEEYLAPDQDEFGRYPGESSLMYRCGFLERPLVDEWILELYHALRRKFPLLPPIKRQFRVLPTFDIDVAYCFLGRSWWRRTRSSVKDIFRFKWQRREQRKLVLNGEVPDTFDSYSYQERICSQAKTECRHFFLLGDYGKYDKNISHKEPILRKLIHEVSHWSEVGIHPSIGSHRSEKKLKKEIKRLKSITRDEVSLSRQHYLKFELPESYRRLIRSGVKEDYSMGFADKVGFRAGTCSPFRWYDLQREESTPLYLIPTIVMDSTLKDYMGLDIEEAKSKMKELRDAIQKVNGTLVILWHNHSAARQGEWIGWRSVLEAGLFD